MTPAERIAVALGERFDELDAAAMAAHPAFLDAAVSALDVLDESSVVEEVCALGSLVGARDPHRVIVARLRKLSAFVSERARMAEEASEQRRWARVAHAVRRGETLRSLVERGDLYADEAVEMLRRDLSDDGLREIALAALEGGKP
jgi:hypothetical protein